MFQPASSEFDPIERGAIAVLDRAVHPDTTLDADLAHPKDLELVWRRLTAELLAMCDTRFDQVERAADRLLAHTSTNLSTFIRDRVEDILIDIIHWRWTRWALREEAEGRNPYQAWTTAAA